MEGYQWAIVLKPLGALVFFGLVLLPVRLAVQKWMPEGKLKKLLLRRVDRRSEKPQDPWVRQVTEQSRVSKRT